MRPSLILVLLALLPQVTACSRTPQSSVAQGSAPSSWYSFTASDGSYSIKFPGKPTETTKSADTAIGPIKVVFESYTTNGGQRAFFSSSTHYNVDPARYNVEKGLDGARDGAVRSAGGTLSNETIITSNGVSGRQFYMTIPNNGRAKYRIFIVNSATGPTIYQAFVMDASGSVDDADTNTFLNSLTFAPK